MLVQTAKYILQEVEDEIQFISIRKLPQLKKVLIKAQRNGIFHIPQSLIQKLDARIIQNMHHYQYNQLKDCVRSTQKNMKIHNYVALMCKDLIQKHLHYLYMQTKRQSTSTNFKQNIESIEYCLPGQSITQINLQNALNKIYDMQLYLPFAKIFKSFILNQFYRFKSIRVFKLFVQYQFRYFFIIGNRDISRVEVLRVIVNTIQYIQQQNYHAFQTHQVQLLKFAVVLCSLANKDVDAKLIAYHNTQLNYQLLRINTLTQDNFTQIFLKSLQSITIDNEAQTIVLQIFQKINIRLRFDQQNDYNKHINQQLNLYSENDKKFMINVLTSFVLSYVNKKNKNNSEKSSIILLINLLVCINKHMNKKFSKQYSSIQKLIKLAESINNLTKQNEIKMKQKIV